MLSESETEPEPYPSSDARGPRFDVSVDVLDGLALQFPAEWLEQVAKVVLATRVPPAETSVSLLVADDDLVRELNSRHRGLDEETDVLSFSFTHQGEYYGDEESAPPPDHSFDFVLPPGQQASLGEVIISYPQALRQAAKSGHPVEKELAFLVIHGILHLLRHDHQVPKEEAEMKELESKLLEKVWDKTQDQCEVC